MSTRFAFAGAPLALFLLLFALPNVQAADIALSSQCGLADAIIAANTDRAEGGCRAGDGADTITLTRDITLDGGLPQITSNITIEGEGYTISGDNRYRIFNNDGGALTINNLTMSEGAESDGGAIFNWRGTLVISESTFSDNSAEYRGAIANWGTLAISESTFSDNSAELGGAIANIEGELSISDSTFSNNSADDSSGAIANWGELSISNSTFSDNSAGKSGGAIYNWGELSISSGTFSDNSAGKSSGAIYNVGELSISSGTFSDNSASDFGGAIANEGELSISDSTFSNNSADRGGGAIDSSGELSISNSTFSDNSVELGGGGAIANSDELSIINSAFQNNLAVQGGAIFNWEELSIINSAFSDNLADQGGAIFNGDDGELSITNSTFSDNSAERGGAIDNRGKLSMTNSTFSDNSAERGGAIENVAELNITNSTFSDNSAERGGAVDNWGDGELSISNSIIAGRGSACYSSNGLKQNINNLIQDSSCSAALSGDPMLGALVEPEDGSTAHYPLMADSPAIGAADEEYCPDTDQVGTVRPQGSACNIGAIEYTTTIEPENSIIIVSTTSLNVRRGPGTNYGVVDSFQRGEEAVAIGRNADGSWLQMNAGWVFAQLVEARGSIGILPVTSE